MPTPDRQRTTEDDALRTVAGNPPHSAMRDVTGNSPLAALRIILPPTTTAGTFDATTGNPVRSVTTTRIVSSTSRDPNKGPGVTGEDTTPKPRRVARPR
jgi:hypothetical protein